MILELSKIHCRQFIALNYRISKHDCSAATNGRSAKKMQCIETLPLGRTAPARALASIVDSLIFLMETTAANRARRNALRFFHLFTRFALVQPIAAVSLFIWRALRALPINKERESSACRGLRR